MQNQPSRRSIRLKNYDYSQHGVYVITLCIQNRLCLFGNIVNEMMILNEAGKMIEEEWYQLALRFCSIQLDEYIIMPNHFHGIIIVGAPLVGARNNGQAQDLPLQNPQLSEIVSALKSITTHKYTHGVKSHRWKPFDGKLWQRNYYEHIIRDEEDFFRAKEYIRHNPQNWKHDKINPSKT